VGIRGVCVLIAINCTNVMTSRRHSFECLFLAKSALKRAIATVWRLSHSLISNCWSLIHASFGSRTVIFQGDSWMIAPIQIGLH
jgi:hypothetical protein